ncbi:hypothetical protein [Mesorhizobium dulcispinae]|uniref:hypothetical protein n=1 Tax=Mesorhizobium dulcispinae TaxID=3072316 RepID=UPI002A24ADF4|nr:hypothetical protein [Mesorhizobium sp. VK23D]MDX8522734.1 hypothetical protein [Mesorhizobium sp. VK23D]
MKLVIGDECNLLRRRSHTAAARYLNPDRDGVLDGIDGEDLAATITGVVEVKLYVKPKTLIARKGDYKDMLGHVIATSPSLAGTDDILQHATDSIRWSITPIRSSSEPEN